MKFLLSLWVFFVINIYAMDFEREVVSNLAISCMKQFLEQNGGVPIIKDYSMPFSKQELSGAPKNCCAVAVVDCTTRKANYFLYSMVPDGIRRSRSACVEGMNNYAVFVSNFESRTLKDNISRLYKQYFQSLTCTAVLESIPDIVSNVRKSDSEQLMLLALEPKEVRERLFQGMDIDNDIRLVVYSIRDSCQHCHFMLSGFLKEMLETQKLRAIDLFFSFSVGISYGIKSVEIRKRTSLCLIPPLFRNIPCSNEESVRSLIVADCNINGIGNSILIPGKIKDPNVADVIFQQAGVVFQDNATESIFASRLNELIPRMDLNAFQHIAKNTLMRLWSMVETSYYHLKENNILPLLFNLLSKARDLKDNETLTSLKKIHLIEKEGNPQLSDICRELGLLEE